VPKTRYQIIVTYEFPEAPPETFATEAIGSSAAAAASRALRAARKAFAKRRPSSIVVLLEPQKDAAKPAGEEPGIPVAASGTL
jgi:hypothetical protein